MSSYPTVHQFVVPTVEGAVSPWLRVVGTVEKYIDFVGMTGGCSIQVQGCMVTGNATDDDPDAASAKAVGDAITADDTLDVLESWTHVRLKLVAAGSPAAEPTVVLSGVTL